MHSPFRLSIIGLAGLFVTVTATVFAQRGAARPSTSGPMDVTTRIVASAQTCGEVPLAFPEMFDRRLHVVGLPEVVAVPVLPLNECRDGRPGAHPVLEGVAVSTRVALHEASARE